MKSLKRGSFNGKTVEFASSERIEAFQRMADDFMLEIFDLVPGEYLITDESSLLDFTEVGDSDSDASSEKRVGMFAAIEARKGVQ